MLLLGTSCTRQAAQLAVSFGSSVRDRDPFRLGAGDPNVWIKQLDTGPLNPMTLEGGDRPAWTPEGQSVTYLSDRAGQFDLYVQRADGSGPAVLLWAAILDLTARQRSPAAVFVKFRSSWDLPRNTSSDSANRVQVPLWCRPSNTRGAHTDPR